MEEGTEKGTAQPWTAQEDKISEIIPSKYNLQDSLGQPVMMLFIRNGLTITDHCLLVLLLQNQGHTLLKTKREQGMTS